jgi:hypothetical protein
VESLESVTLLSGLALPGAVAPAAVGPMLQAPAPSATLDISGTQRGFYAAYRANPDAGTSYSLFGYGRLGAIGIAYGVGHVTTPGFIATGRATGTFTLYAAGGTVDLSVTSRPLPGFSTLPSLLIYTITGGTGAYSHAKGYGTIDVTLRPLSPAGAPPNYSSGALTLAFHSTPAPPPMA